MVIKTVVSFPTRRMADDTFNIPADTHALFASP
jgi:hypothetical protein